jgi:peptidoglycan/LPS O-acetylase OafA/YrhL
MAEFIASISRLPGATELTNHIPTLDGLRGSAALAVVAMHLRDRGIIFPTEAGFLGSLGVTLFFTLSGFLMAYLYGHKRFTFATVYGYAIGRFSRIAPVYLFVVVTSYFIVRYIDSSFVYQITDRNVLRHLLFSGNVDVFWSIPPEVQFYIFFIVIWWGLDRFSAGYRWPLAAGVAAIIIMQLYAGRAPGTTLPSRIHFFALGAIAGLWRFYRPQSIASNALLVSLQGALSMLLVTVSYFLYNTDPELVRADQFTDNSVYFSASYSVLCAATILVFSYPSAVANGLFGNRPLRLMGAWSFSLYLLHEPFLQIAELVVKSGITSEWIAVVIFVSASILAAMAAHNYVEKTAQAAIRRVARELLVRGAPRYEGHA